MIDNGQVVRCRELLQSTAKQKTEPSVGPGAGRRGRIGQACRGPGRNGSVDRHHQNGAQPLQDIEVVLLLLLL